MYFASAHASPESSVRVARLSTRRIKLDETAGKTFIKLAMKRLNAVVLKDNETANCPAVEVITVHIMYNEAVVTSVTTRLTSIHDTPF